MSAAHSYSLVVAAAPALKLTGSHQSVTMWSMASNSVALTATPAGGVAVPTAPPTIVSGLPTGIAATWSSPTVSSAGAVTWTLTLTGSVNAVASSGTLNFSVSGTAGGQTYAASLALPLVVSFNTPTLTFAPAATHVITKQGTAAADAFTFTGAGSFHGSVALTVAGLPSTVSSSWSNAVALSDNSGSSTLTLSPSAATATGWYNFTVTATGDGLTVSRTLTLEVYPTAGVQAQLSSAAATIEPQGKATITVTATAINGIAAQSGGSIAAVASSLPRGVTASWSSPSSIAGGVAWTLTLTADGTAQAGASTVVLSTQITDASSGLVYSASPSLSLLTSLLAKVNVGTTAGPAIPANFLGLSHEWGDAQWQMGSAATGANAIYRQLLTNLTAYGSGPFNLRIGGNSTDTRGEPTPTTVEPFVELANALGAQFELGVNLGAGNVQLAVDQATDYASQMPAGSLLALEIGNEVDLYPSNGLRPPSYNFQNYVQEFDTWKGSIQPALPQGVALAGPVAAEYFFGSGASAMPTQLANAQSFLTRESSALALFTQHFYAASPQSNPPPDFLLNPSAATAGASMFAKVAQTAQAYGVPFRVAETGAVSDGGLAGVSDTFASALWSADAMFNYASIGVAGVNWESGNGGANEPFYFTLTYAGGKANYALQVVKPIYYGMLFFEAALGGGAQLLPVTLQTPANLTAWATEPKSSTPRLAIINKDEAQSGIVSITMPGYSTATVLRLSAPSYSSTNGVTFAGQTMDGSVDGTLQGNQAEQTIQAGADGSFEIAMPVTSAALVIFGN